MKRLTYRDLLNSLSKKELDMPILIYEEDSSSGELSIENVYNIKKTKDLTPYHPENLLNYNLDSNQILLEILDY